MRIPSETGRARPVQAFRLAVIGLALVSPAAIGALQRRQRSPPAQPTAPGRYHEEGSRCANVSRRRSVP
jgi:hypothetical protein